MISRRDWCRVVGGAFGCAAAGYRDIFAATQTPVQRARFWRRDGMVIKCDLCPHGCLLPEGKTGLCRNRQHQSGELAALGYGRPCAVHVDPMEKKPFYHVLPGARTFSIGVAGCNLRCKNCQNYTISQRSPSETGSAELPPSKAVEEALRRKCSAIVFTYTEPTVWIEYVIDTAAIARKAGLLAAVVTAGFVNALPFEELTKVVDAVRVDLKSFSDDTYRKLNAGTLQPVLDTLLLAKKRGVWLEVINLVVPGWNDDPKEQRALCSWVKRNLGAETPLHFSRCYPMHQLSGIYPTPVSTLEKAVAIAREEGLSYAYIGNVAEIGGTTYCPTCGKALIGRSGYTVTFNKVSGGKCGYCGCAIPGVWRN